jgi:hypothetical protein
MSAMSPNCPKDCPLDGNLSKEQYIEVEKMLEKKVTPVLDKLSLMSAQLTEIKLSVNSLQIKTGLTSSLISATVTASAGLLFYLRSKF